MLICTLCIRYLTGPVLVTVLLVMAEMVQPHPERSFLVKIGLALAGFGLGSVLPYLASDEALYLKFATIQVQDDGNARNNAIVMTFGTEDKIRYDFVRTLTFFFFLSGLVIWLGNYFLSERLERPQSTEVVRGLESFTITRGFWLTGIAYCLLAGVLYVYLSLGRKTNFMQGGPKFLAGERNPQPAGQNPINIPVPERQSEKRD